MRFTYCMFFLLLLIKSSLLFSQVAINADGTKPNNSAMLDVKSSNKGLLPPRMTHVDMSLIPNPADGLIVYCTDCGQDGNGVLSIFMGGDWKILTANCLTPISPIVKTHIPSTSNIVWDWNGVPYATGYKWNIINDYGTATQMDTITKKAEKGLVCNTNYIRYVWAYNDCGNSLPLILSKSTLACSVPTLTTTVATALASTGATSGGNITNDGGSEVTIRGVCWGTDTNPTIANFKTTDGAGAGAFTSNLTGLNENTTYYLRAYAKTSAGTGYGNEIVFKTNTTITDIDGNVYNTVTIGTQVWMVENLKTTKYRNGDPIPKVTVNSSWAGLATGAYCFWNDEIANKMVYGCLYNWFAVADSRNIAPIGWHVPTDLEWTTLTIYLGGESVAGGKLKEAGTAHWQTPNAGATNSTGFTALPGGYRYASGGNFVGMGSYGHWWSSSSTVDAAYAYDRNLYYYDDFVSLYSDYKQYGFSVRCIRD